MNNSELLLRNSSIQGIPRADIPEAQLQMLKENGKLIQEEELTKLKVKRSILEQMLTNSKTKIANSDGQDIAQRMELIEERVYLRTTQGQKKYLEKLIEQLKESQPEMKDSQSKVEAITSKIFGKIESGEINFHKREPLLTKEQIKELTSPNMARAASSKRYNNVTNNHSINASRYDQPVNSPNLFSQRQNRSLHEIGDYGPNQSSYDPQQFIKKLRKEQQEAKVQQEIYLKKQEEKKKQEKLFEEETKATQKLKKREIVSQSLQSLKETKDKRHNDIKQHHQEFQQYQKCIKEKKPLFLILEEDNKLQNAEIAIQQEKLKELREHYRPLKMEELQDHAKKYKEHKEQDSQRRLNESTRSINNSLHVWKGKMQEFIKEEIKKEKVQRSTSEEKRAQLEHLERLKTYGAMVKANYIPKIDEAKVKERTTRNTEMGMPKTMIAKQILKQEINEEPNLYKLGNDNLEHMKKYVSEHRRQSEDKSLVKDVEIESFKQSRYKNYMREDRVKDQLKKDDPKKDWQSSLNKYQGTERVEKVLNFAQQLDQQAIRKEMSLKHNNKNLNVGMIEELEDCYFNSIKAKIALLKEANQITD